MTVESERAWRRAFVLGVSCLVIFAAVFLVAVRTAPGQRFEDSILRAADRSATTAEQVQALNTLDTITVPSVIVGMIFVLLVALFRRRILLGLLSVGMIVASIATSEAIQRMAHRPILLSHGFRREDQSFPSGHAAVAMSLMCAVVMVVPYRFRGLAVFLASLWAASVGVATVTAGWHRPSDTIGSDLIVVGYTCAALAVLARWGRVREAALRTSTGRVLRGLLAGAYAAVAVLGFAVAAVVVARVFSASSGGGTGASTLLAGRSLALSGSAAVAVTLLALLRHMDLGAPVTKPAGEGSPDDELRHSGIDRPSGP